MSRSRPHGGVGAFALGALEFDVGGSTARVAVVAQRQPEELERRVHPVLIGPDAEDVRVVGGIAGIPREHRRGVVDERDAPGRPAGSMLQPCVRPLPLRMMLATVATTTPSSE
jgi:hypothetical protein